MARLILTAALLFGIAASALAQNAFNSLLYTSANITNDESNPTEFPACEASSALNDIGAQTSTEQLQNIQVDGRWFGGSMVSASQFSVEDCSAITLQNGRTVDVFSSASTMDCQVSWFMSGDFVTVFVNVSSEDAFWTVSLPRVASAITRSSCYGTRSQCPLASTVPCNNINFGSTGLTSFTATGSAADQCVVGEASDDYQDDMDLLYGLKGSFYPGTFDCNNRDPTVQYSAPNLTKIAPDHSFDRCQDALDYTVPNTTFPSTPALPDAEFSSCYSARLDGYVLVENYTDLQFLTPQPVPSYYNSYRVCLRFSNLVKLYLNGKLLIESTTGDYDAVLTCLDVPYLPQGLIPFTVEFSSPPNAVDSVILQFFIIPVSQVVTDNRPGRQYQVTYKCDCCGLFSAAGSCCKPLDKCYFRTPECGPQGPAPSIPSYSPPPPRTIPAIPPVRAPAPAPKTPAQTPMSSRDYPPPPLPTLPSHPAPGPAPRVPPTPAPFPPMATPPAPLPTLPATPGPAPVPMNANPPPPPVSHTPAPGPSKATPPPPLPTLPPTTPPGPGPSNPPTPGPGPSTGSIPPRTQPPSPVPAKGPSTPPSSQPPAVTPAKPPTQYCPCDNTCIGKPTLADGEDITFNTFRQIVNSASTWEELEGLLQA